MKISTFYHHILEAQKQTGISIPQLLTEFKAAGIEGIEVDYQEYENDSSLKEELDKAGMEVSCVCRLFHFESNTDPIPGRQLVDAALALNCKKVMVIPGFYQDDRSNEEVRQAILGPLAELVAYAKENNVTVVLEDYDNVASPVATSEGMKWMADRIPELYYAFDTGNFYYSEEDELDAFEVLKDKIRHVHCKDRVLSTKYKDSPSITAKGVALYPAPFGSGIIKCEEVLNKICETGYDDYLVIELFNAANQREYLLKSAEWLKAWMRTSYFFSTRAT